LNDRAFIDGSMAASWHFYKMVQGRFEVPDLANHHLSVGAQAMWQDETQVTYFGIGSQSNEADRSQYQMTSTDVVGYAAIRPASWFTIGGELGYLFRPDISPPGGTFTQGWPDTLQQFPNDPGVGLPFQPNFRHSELSVTADTRDHRSYPTSGFLYRAAMTSYSDQSTGTFSFREYEAEGAHFLPVTGRNWIFALHGWVLVSDVPEGHQIPFYMMPAIGGNNSIRSYLDYRFHDQNLVVVNAESRWALYTHLDAALFVDAGNVAPRAGDLNLDKNGYGAGLRLHTDRATFARLDVAHGPEGWLVVFRTSDPFRLSRLSRRVAAVPFVP
jgi:hypothetical protein